MAEAHELILQLIPQIHPIFKWRTPFFDYCGGYFCYLNKYKDHIYIGFINKKNELVSEHLDIVHLKTTSKAYIPDRELLRSDALSELIIQAAVIHEAMHRK